MGDEAYALSMQYDDYFISSTEFVNDIKSEMRTSATVYAFNKKKKVGEQCQCAGPMCNKRFIKKSYQQAFCRTKCKDQFWNRIKFWKDEDKVQALCNHIDSINYGSDHDDN
ncbi:MAG TPA: hypothetical protein HA367_06180 [Candidatus Methanofastidiosum sp.]|nr:hypothetical protein [Methanofastidiosum sp.]